MVDRQDRMPRAIRKRNGMHQTSGKAGDLPQVEAACVPCSCSSLPPRGSVRLDWCLCCHVRRSLFHLTSPLRVDWTPGWGRMGFLTLPYSLLVDQLMLLHRCPSG